MSTTKLPINKLATVNGLRGFAILLVLYQHVVAFPLSKALDFTPIITQGWIGVNLFFVLSGFVLYLPYLRRTKQLQNKNDLFDFYKNRFFRLYPLYILVLLISLIFVHNLSFEGIAAFFKSLFCLSAILEPNFFPKLNGIFWSLEVEILYSLIFPALLIIIRKYGIIKIMAVSFILAFISRTTGILYAKNFESGEINIFTSSLTGHIDDFLAGMFIAHLYTQQVTISFFKSQYAFLSIIIFLLGVCVLIDYRLFNLFPAFQNILLSTGFSALLYTLLISNGIWVRLFSFRPLQLTGAMCFSIYSWHLFFVGKPMTAFYHNVLGYSIYFIVLFILSAITYRYIEFGNEKSLKKLFYLN